MNGLHPCKNCQGNGFKLSMCDCREAGCPHAFDDTDPREGLYGKFWVRRTDGSSADGEKHADCDYFVLDKNGVMRLLAVDLIAERAKVAEARALLGRLEVYGDDFDDVETLLAKWDAK